MFFTEDDEFQCRTKGYTMLSILQLRALFKAIVKVKFYECSVATCATLWTAVYGTNVSLGGFKQVNIYKMCASTSCVYC